MSFAAPPDLRGAPQPVRRSVSLAIRHPADPGLVLLVRRPAEDPDLPGAWGLPAASLRADETPEAAARRCGREKLGVEVELGPRVASCTAERPAYELEMDLFAAEIAGGEPRVPQPAAGVTQYTDWRWGPRDELRPAAARGSLCCRLALGE